MTHEPLCQQQPRDDGTTLTMLDGKPVYCTCALIAKVREDTLAKCIDTAVKAYRSAPEGYSDNEAFEVAITALRALQSGVDNVV